MLENFQLAAITGSGTNMRLYRIPLHQGLQATLAVSWSEQLDRFTENMQEIDFNAGYTPEEHERFRLSDYDLPTGLHAETSQSIPDLAPITGDDNLLGDIKGIVAFARIQQGVEVVLFQNFSRAHIIAPGRFLFLTDHTYETARRPGLTLDNKLSAAFFPAQRKLLFHNFRTVNTFLPLAEFYQEASESEIRSVLGHQLLSAEDADALAVNANQWFRKRFAMLRDSGILDNYSAQDIRGHSSGYDVDIQIEQGKIVFPAEKAAAKRLLQFLNEELFRGAITETLYETNSKREAD